MERVRLIGATFLEPDGMPERLTCPTSTAGVGVTVAVGGVPVGVSVIVGVIVGVGVLVRVKVAGLVAVLVGVMVGVPHRVA